MTRRVVEGVILENLGNPQFCVKRLALILNVSRSYLRKAVHQHFQTSPQKLIQEMRLALATRLLLEGEKIQNVSRHAGYGSDRSFRAAFRRDKGMAPKDFRKVMHAA
ncbi:MAG TPA: AraC family transcriptional regulator [bacterium]|nr:AraC family transcriptional regulator [bacterium]HQI48262.1 AraC family transcriptional regulator [bacterium]HQJ65994.1 AraC family transcriptional regulator [bacterium]